MEEDEILQQFIGVTGQSPDSARQYLEVCSSHAVTMPHGQGSFPLLRETTELN